MIFNYFTVAIFVSCYINGASQVLGGKRIHLPVQEMKETETQSLGQEDPLKRKWQLTPVSCLKIPRTEEPSGCNPYNHKVSHD